MQSTLFSTASSRREHHPIANLICIQPAHHSHESRVIRIEQLKAPTLNSKWAASFSVRRLSACPYIPPDI